MIDLSCRIGPLALTQALVALAHDLRNPLNTIMLQAERARVQTGKQVPQDAQLLTTLDRVRREVERLDQTLDAYLEVLGLPAAVCQPTSVKTLIDAVVERAGGCGAAERLAIELETPHAVWPIDLVLMADALEILLQRAVRHLTADASIKLRVFEQGDAGWITIADAAAAPQALDVYLSVARQCILAQGGTLRTELATHASAPPQVAIVMPRSRHHPLAS